MEPTKSTALKITIRDGAEHTLFAEYSRPDNCSEDITWRMAADMELDAIVEEIVRLLDKLSPQRISVPAFQVFLGISDQKDILTAIDMVVDQARGTPHMVSVPTFRYTPSLFVFWSDVTDLNRYVWTKAVESATPILNLHKTFLARQSKDWVVAGTLYVEFNTGHGLGQTLTDVAQYRYAARIFRFHINGYGANNAPMSIASDCVPLPLEKSYNFVENTDIVEMLTGLGCELRHRSEKGQRVKMAAAAKKSGKAPEKPAAKVKGVKRQRHSEADDRPFPSLPGSSSSNSATLEADYHVVSLDRTTYRDMIRENGEMRSKVRDLTTRMRRKDEEGRGLRRQMDKLEREVKSLTDKCKHHDNNYYEVKRLKDVEAQLKGELYECQWERDEGLDDVDALKEKLDREKRRYEILETKLEAFEKVLGKKEKRKGE